MTLNYSLTFYLVPGVFIYLVTYLNIYLMDSENIHGPQMVNVTDFGLFLLFDHKFGFLTKMLSTTFGWIVIRFLKDIHFLLRMNQLFI